MKEYTHLDNDDSDGPLLRVVLEQIKRDASEQGMVRPGDEPLESDGEVEIIDVAEHRSYRKFSQHRFPEFSGKSKSTKNISGSAFFC